MEQSVNSFNKGLLKDTNPMILGNEVLSDALNATFVTGGQGDELVLQNDMGNRKIEEAYLPTGYVPVGIKEYGGIIYIASYNPITNRGLIGSFPSPERTVLYLDDGEEINFGFDTFLENGFCFLKELNKIFVIYKDILHVGDKFAILDNEAELWSNPEYKENISNFCNVENGKVISPKNKQYTLSVGILDLGNNFIDITKSLNRYEVVEKNGTTKVNLLEKTNNPTYNFNMGYFIGGLFEVTEDIVLDYRDIVGISKNGNLYKYKNNSPLCIKVLHNYPNKFSYSIKGKASENKESVEKLVITATLEYNCPDGGLLDDGNYENNNNYNNYYTYSSFMCDWFNFFTKNIDDEEYWLRYNMGNEIFSKEITNPITLERYNYSGSTIDWIREYDRLLKMIPYDPSSKLYRDYYEGKMTLQYQMSNNSDYYEKITYDKENNKYICRILKKFENLEYNRIENGNHIIDYFIGVPYNLLDSAQTCDNPYIRRLSYFGEINIDELNSDVFNIKVWKFKTGYLNEEYITTVYYEFSSIFEEEFEPISIELYNVTDLISPSETIYIENLVGNFKISNKELGEAYKVVFKRNDEILKENIQYWIICTELFNDRDLESNSKFIGNNYVEVPETITKGDNKYETLQNLKDLLTVPLKALLKEESLNSSILYKGHNFDKDLCFDSPSLETPIGTLTQNYSGNFDILIGVDSLNILEDLINLYPKYIKNAISNSSEIEIGNITLNELTPTYTSGNIGDLQENNIQISLNNITINHKFENSKLHIYGNVNLDYTYKFRYICLGNTSSLNEILLVTLYDDSIFNVLGNIGIVFIKENNKKKIKLIGNLVLAYLFAEDPTKGLSDCYTTLNYISYNNNNNEIYNEEESIVIRDIKKNFQTILKAFNLQNTNIICTYIQNSGTNILYRYDDDDNSIETANDNIYIFWMKTRRNSENNIEWVPFKYITRAGNNFNSESSFKDKIKDYLSNNLTEIFNTIKLKHPNKSFENNYCTLYVPSYVNSATLENMYRYSAFTYNYPNLNNRIILSDSKYDYGIWAKFNNTKFTINNSKLNGIDDTLSIFNFNVNNSELTLSFEEFLAPIKTELSFDTYIDKWEAPDTVNYFVIKDGDTTIDSILINREENNIGTFHSTGCYLKLRCNNKNEYYPLHTRLQFLYRDENNKIKVSQYPIMNGDKSSDEEYFGTSSDSMAVFDSGSPLLGITFDNNNNLITHLFRYAFES